MKRWWIAVPVAIVLLGLAGVALAVWGVDSDLVRQRVVESASRSLGRQVEMGELELVFFPSPAVRAGSLQVEGEPGEPALLRAEEIRLRLALWPLLKRRVVIAAAELRQPTVRLPVDADGRPVLPEFGSDEATEASPGRPAPKAPAEGAAPEADAAGSTPVRLEIDALTLEDGTLEVGAWGVSQLRVQGAIVLDGVSELEGSARLDGLGEVRDVRLRIQGLAAGAPEIDGSAEILDLDLAALAGRLGLVPDPLAALAGRLSGSLRASLRGGEVESALAELQVADLVLENGEIAVQGDVPIEASFVGPFTVDLTSAEVRAPSLRKPSGETLQLTGELGPQPGLAKLRLLQLALGPNRVPIVPDLALDTRTLRIAPCRIELAPLAAWMDTGEAQQLSGAIEIKQPVEVDLQPLRATGQLNLVGLSVPVEQGVARLDGPLTARGQKIRFDALTLSLGGQSVELDGGYDLAASEVELDLGIADADLQELLVALTGSSKLTGTLGAGMKLAGAPALESLRGSGQFEIAPGEIRDFSLLRQLLGELGPLVEQILRAKGKDLARYEQEQFERLTGDFALEGGQMQVRSLALAYRYGRAELRGTVGLLGERPLDLSGTITLPPEVASDLLRKERDQPLTIPDVRIAGTVDSPRVSLDRENFARLVTRIAAEGEVRRKLDEKVEEAIKEKLGGSDADVDAVKGVLEGILGGKKRKEE